MRTLIAGRITARGWLNLTCQRILEGVQVQATELIAVRFSSWRYPTQSPAKGNSTKDKDGQRQSQHW